MVCAGNEIRRFIIMAKPNFVSYKHASKKPAAKKEKISKAKKIAEGKTAAKLAAIADQRKPRW
jgi:hypothetical protein